MANNIIIRVTVIATTIRKYCCGNLPLRIQDGQPNPELLSIATGGYKYQQNLHMPDRYGFFSHPSSQSLIRAEESGSLIFLAFLACLCIAINIPVTSFMWFVGFQNALLAGSLAFLVGAGVALAVIWWLNVFERKNRPGHVLDVSHLHQE